MLSNNSESLILGANYSLHFLGPPHGVLPIGPNGFHGFGTLSPPLMSTLWPSTLSDAETNAAILSYNYTLNHQGLTSNISCIYDTQSPIRSSAVRGGSCNDVGLADFITIPVDAETPGDETLTFWACKTEEQNPTYHIYLRGHGKNYERDIGNISCTVSPMQPAIFPVMYQSSTHVFSTQGINSTEPPPAKAKTFFDFIEHVISRFGIAVQQAQTGGVNLLAESAKVLGIQGGFGRFTQNKQYLPLYAAIIQGILVDNVCTARNFSRPLLMVFPQLTYMRFLYSTVPANNFKSPPPASCRRPVSGVMSADVMGWVAKPVHIAFLMPMTILNLASLIIALITIARAKKGFHEFDLTDPRSLVSAECSLAENDHSGWADGVSYRPREVCEFQI